MSSVPVGKRRRSRRHRPAEQPVPLEQLLTYRISILAKLLERQSASFLEKTYELGVAEWRVLAQLSVRSPSTVRWLAARMRVDRAEVSRAAAALAGRGFVRRAADPRDARSVLFWATAKGRRIYGEIMPSRRVLHERLLAAVSPREAEAFMAAVERWTKLLSDDQKDAVSDTVPINGHG